MKTENTFANSSNLARYGVWLLFFVTLSLSGCAGYVLNRDGLSMMEKGEYEEGLKKLSEASSENPRDVNYRADYIRYLEKTVNRLLANASSKKGAGQYEQAQAVFEQVLRIAPGNSRAKLGLDEIAMEKRHAVTLKTVEDLLKKNDLDGAQAALKQVLLENVKNGKAILLQRQIDDRYFKEQTASVALLSKFKKPVNLQFRDANLKLVFEALSRTTGINILLDREVKADLKTSVFAKDVSVEDTIDIILLQNQLEKKILNENSVFVYPNTPAKIKEYKELKIRSFHLVNADAKQMLTMIKTLLKTKDIFVHEKTNSLVMRDTPEAIRLAEKIISDQDGSDPEVMLEVEVIEVASSRLSELGINYPSQLTVVPTNAAGSTTGLTLSDLGNLNRDRLAVSSISAGLNLKLQDGGVNMLASPRIRVRHREKAKILIGDRVPVISQATQLGAGGTTSASSSVNYLDVGLKLEVEPDIHADSEVGIKINLEVSNIVREIQVGSATSGFTLAYQVGTRTASTILRLKDGETQVLAGLINDDERNSSNKVPGLGQLPVIGRLFSNQRDENHKTEIILSITPHIVGNVRLQDANEIEFWTGTESSLSSKSASLKTIADEPVNANVTGLTPKPVQRTEPQLNQTGQAINSDAPKVDASGAPAIVKNASIASAQTAMPPRPAVQNPESVGALTGTPDMVMTWLGPAQARIGSKLNLTLNGRATQGVSGMSLLVNFDPSVLKVNGVSEGSFWKKAGITPTFTRSIDQENGQIVIDVLQPVGEEGVKGVGSITTLNFDVIAAKPQSQITVSRVTPMGDAGNSISVTVPEPHNLILKP